MLFRTLLPQKCRLQDEPARYGPVSLSVSSARVFAVASRSRTLRRIAGDCGARQGCSALAQKLARKRERGAARTSQCCSRDRNILPNKIPARNRVLYPPARQETQLYRCSRIRASLIAHRFREPPQAPNLNSYDTMEEPGIEPAAKSGLRPRRRPSARASARRGKQSSLRNSHETRRPRTTTSRPPSRRTSKQDRRRGDSSSRPTTPCPPTGARKAVGTCEGGSSAPWWAWTASSSPNSATSRPG